MKNKRKKLGAVMIAAVLSVTILSGCSPKKTADTPQTSDSSRQASEENNQDANIYELPLMGMNTTLPESMMEREDVTMLMNQIPTEDGSSLEYGYLRWELMSPQPQEDGADPVPAGYYDPENSLGCIGVLGVYQADMADKLDELTGCDEHRELGQSADGAYKYYLSINTKMEKELTDKLNEIQITITEMESFEEAANDEEPSRDSSVTSVGEFTTEDINGKSYTQEMFQDYDLTMINVFTTWCSPCVAEIPELEKLRSAMAEKGVNVVGVVMDVLDEKGEINQENLEKAQLLAERTGATYPFLLPDASYMNGRLTGIDAFPETFFVDKDGNIVGETYSGSAGLKEWTSVVEKELSNVKGEK